jgi:hypothetical protein
MTQQQRSMWGWEQHCCSHQAAGAGMTDSTAGIYSWHRPLLMSRLLAAAALLLA